MLAQAGIPLMPARVFVALLTADAPRLTADDIAGILQVSPAAVSGAVRYLLPIGLVSPGDRAGLPAVLVPHAPRRVDRGGPAP